MGGFNELAWLNTHLFEEEIAARLKAYEEEVGLYGVEFISYQGDFDPLRGYTDSRVMADLREAQEMVKNSEGSDDEYEKERADIYLGSAITLCRARAWRECVDLGIIFLTIIILGCLFMICLHKSKYENIQNLGKKYAGLSTGFEHGVMELPPLGAPGIYIRTETHSPLPPGRANRPGESL